jgi:hypothetical protein
MNKQIQITKTEDGLLLSNLPEGFSQASCQAVVLEQSKLLIHAGTSEAASAITLSKCSGEMLFDFLLGIHRREWTGKVRVESGKVSKSLFFRNGTFIFASSDLIDDRLGEVIYRDEMISLDQLTSFAVKVDRKNKFGQVLLRSGAFTSLDLWKALKMQANEILRSVFLPDNCYVEIHSGAPPIALSFEDKTEELIESAYLYGANHRVFKSRLKPSCSVSVKTQSPLSKESKGTFLSDMLEMCKDKPTWDVILKRSKLSETNTIVTLMKLVANGQIQISGLSEVAAQTLQSNQAKLDNAIGLYKSLVKKARDTFDKAALEFPINDLAAFALTLNSDGGAAIFLDDNGDLTADSVINIYQQCITNRSRVEYFQLRIEALSRFLFQVSGDLLPAESMGAIRSSAPGV